MKRKLQNAVSVLLVFSMLCCILAFTPISAGAAEADETVAASTVKTRDEAVAWLRAQEGARYDIDGAYGSQCSDFTSAYVNYVLTGNPYGGRIGVYNANQYSNAGLYPSDWQVIQNTASFVPQPGDIFIVNGADSRYGHTGVVISSTVNTATIADQNGMSDWSLDYGSPAHIHDITWTGSGTWAPTYFIRPCFETWHNPEGVVDIIEGGNGKIHVRGWAFDRDDFGNQIPIHVYIGGRSGDANAEGHSITANTQRTDVNSVYGCGDWHGFDAEISTSKRGNQPVYIYALNIGGGNDNPQIGEGTANIKDPSIAADSITINKSTLSLEIGKSETLTATVLPTNATDKTITWTSSDSKVATVTNGKVSAVGVGNATITAKTTNGKTATCQVTVKAANIAVTGISMNKSSLSLEVGKTETLTATVSPTNATDKTVTWTSSDSKVATVTNGKVSAVGVGNATITAKTTNGKTATCQVTVKAANIAVTGISMNKSSLTLEVGQTETLTAIVRPTNATDKTVTWTSSDSKVATVANGKVSAVGAGTATITAKTTNGKTATCQVTVKASVSPDAAQYKMSNATACAGSNVELIVSIENNPGIISMRNQVEYDASALELVGVEDCKLLAGYTNPSPTINPPYSLRWADSLATQNNTANGNLVKLSFRIKEDTSVGDYVVSVKHNEARDTMGTKVEFASADATISVIDFLLGDIDNDGEISDWDAILLNRFLADWPITINEKAADIDKDGEISDWDAITLERYLAGWDIKL